MSTNEAMTASVIISFEDLKAIVAAGKKAGLEDGSDVELKIDAGGEARNATVIFSQGFGGQPFKEIPTATEFEDVFRN